MGAELHAACGVVAGIVSVADGIPYIRDTMARRTRPHRGAWLVWSVIATVACVAHAAAGGTWGLMMLAVQAVQAVLVSATCALAFWFPSGRLSSSERCMLAVAAAGVLGWICVDNPLIATIGVIVADAMAFAIVVPKAWSDPWSETASTYWLASLAGLLTATAVSPRSIELLVYPTYFFVANLGLGLVLLVGRRRQPVSPPLASPAGLRVS